VDHATDPANLHPPARLLIRRGWLFSSMPVTTCPLCAALVLTCGMKQHHGQHTADARRDNGGQS
jgi:hypothetical protein